MHAAKNDQMSLHKPFPRVFLKFKFKCGYPGHRGCAEKISINSGLLAEKR